MSQQKRAVLKFNFSNIRLVPADILARLRADILGTGVHATVASVSEIDPVTLVATVNAELSSELDGDIVKIVQDTLDEKYGAAETSEEEEEEESTPEQETEEEIPSGDKAPEETTESSQEPDSASSSPDSEPKPSADAEETPTEDQK